MRDKVHMIVKERKVPRTEFLKVVKDCTRQQFEIEPDDVKMEVYEEVKAQEKAASSPAEFTPRDFAE